VEYQGQLILCLYRRKNGKIISYTPLDKAAKNFYINSKFFHQPKEFIMNKTKAGFKNLYLPILFIGVIGIQTFTSCSSSDDDAVAPSSSSVSVQSSSSGGGGSSSSVGGSNSFETVTTSTQTWMKHNLNYNVPGSKCYGEGTLPDSEVEANCAKYGRLYDWSTAMALDSSCNSVSCSEEIQPKHQGICPDGWHIPSDAEWTLLENAVGGSSIAGTKLKATSGWNDNGNGTDEFGFSALPGGRGNSDGSFNIVGVGGLWWCATEESSSNAWARFMGYYDGNVDRSDISKSNLYSVRCLQD